MSELSDKKGEEGGGKAIYLFCGEDSFSAYEKAQLWKAKFLEKYGDLNCLIFRGEELTAGEFQGALESYPFLSEKKLIFVQDFLKEGEADDQKKVAEMLDRVPDYAVVLFWEHQKPDARTSLFKKLVKVATLENYELKTGVTLMRWIRERFQKRGVSVGETEIKLIADLVGNNLWNVSNEIEKLGLYAGGQRITKEMVEKVVSPNPSSSIFKLTDLLGEKKLQEAMKTLEILVESGEETVAMFYMLVRHFRIMAQVKDLAERGRNAGEIAKIIKEHPFVVSKVYSQVRVFTREALRQIYVELLAIDSGFKTGRIRITTGDESELVREMEVLITRVCL
jgi:DNA polymerase-3 subunit delta